MLRAVFRAIMPLSLLFGLSLVAWASTIRVPTDQPSLSAALNAAAEGDTIVLADGIYSEGQSPNLYNKGVTIQSASGNPNACILDATSVNLATDDGQPRAFTFRGLTFQNVWEEYAIGLSNYDNDTGNTLTITNCVFNTEAGVGIEINDLLAVLNFTHCTMQDSGIFGQGGEQSGEISDCAFTNSSIWWAAFSSFSVARCTFTNSYLKSFTAGNAQASITDSAFDSCQAGNTALNVYRSLNGPPRCVVKNCTFTNNPSGAIMNNGSTFVTNCAFADNINNTVSDGGAIWNWDGSLTVANSIFAHNTGSRGGAVAGWDGATTLLNCTFAANQADTKGGAVYHVNDGHYSDNGLHIANCVFWGNDAPAGSQIQDDSASLSQISNSLIQDYPGLTSIPDTHGNISADPRFVRAPSPGVDGVWGTADDDLGDLHLVFGSPAVDTANSSLLPPDVADLNNNANTTEPLPFDLDGNPRVSRASVDMGAYEYQNKVPIALPQQDTPTQNSPLAFTLTGSDPEGDSLTYAVVTNPTHGTLSGTAPQLIYTPAPGYVGTDSFTFTVTDAFGAASRPATVSLLIHPRASSLQPVSPPHPHGR